MSGSLAGTSARAKELPKISSQKRKKTPNQTPDNSKESYSLVAKAELP